jgi:hypothetical protein
MIKVLSNILTDFEIQWLNTKCKSFIKTNETEPDGKIWFYNSMFIYDCIELDGYKKRVTGLVGDEYEIQHNGIFINKITPETNLNDDYHVDSSDLSIVTYINEEFTGGQFEYVQNDVTVRIKPSVNLSILMNREIQHRVLKINEGVRYSLITWFKTKNKSVI